MVKTIEIFFFLSFFSFFSLRIIIDIEHEEYDDIIIILQFVTKLFFDYAPSDEYIWPDGEFDLARQKFKKKKNDDIIILYITRD